MHLDNSAATGHDPDIQLAMGPVDLTELLRAYAEEEFLQDDNAYPCPACAGLVQKRLRICPMGSAVMMHLQRFGFNLKGRKLHDHVSFPQVLPLHGQRFDFAGVVTHAGDTLATGHYTASVDTGCLYRCDGHVVARCDWLHVASEQAYLLVYTKASGAEVPLESQAGASSASGHVAPSLPKAGDDESADAPGVKTQPVSSPFAGHVGLQGLLAGRGVRVDISGLSGDRLGILRRAVRTADALTADGNIAEAQSTLRRAALGVLVAYPNDVETWDTLPACGRSKAATFHKGRCQRCADSLKKVEADDSLRGVATFSGQNMMDLLWGFPDVDAMVGQDVGARLRVLHKCCDAATVVEEMLVALLHMQVDVCYLRQGRRRQYTGLPAFRKNIIAFPQELAEVKQLLHYWTSVKPNDIVNVLPADGAVGAAARDIVRARVVALQDGGFLVELRASRVFVPFQRVRQRVVLPWTPQDLRDNFIVLRRRNARRDEYVEDLRVRRNLLRKILQLLTQTGFWRPGHGKEPLHMYYTDFDLRPEHEVQDIFPEEDGVPAGLNFQDLDDAEWLTEFSPSVFQEWLTEGRHNCDVAQALLHAWTHTMQGSASDTLCDLFDQLSRAHAEAHVAGAQPGSALPLLFVARFVLDHCSL